MLTACPGSGGNPTPDPLTQFYAEPAGGLDSNPGTQAKPLKTLKEALSRMGTGAVKTTVLLAGTYSEASGESWGYAVPEGVTLKGNSAGVILQSSTKKSGFTLKGVAFKMRGSTVSGNSNASNADGIYISNATKGIDMGTASDPGGNTLKDNGGSTDPNLSVSGSPATVQLVGNTWNANAQGADAAGHYPSKLVSTTNAYESGKNYYFPKGVSLQF